MLFFSTCKNKFFLSIIQLIGSTPLAVYNIGQCPFKWNQHRVGSDITTAGMSSHPSPGGFTALQRIQVCGEPRTGIRSIHNGCIENISKYIQHWHKYWWNISGIIARETNSLHMLWAFRVSKKHLRRDLLKLHETTKIWELGRNKIIL